jgi:starvation-inducible DNA-binding protein
MANDRILSSTLLNLGAGVEEQVSKILAPMLADTIFVYLLYKKYQLHVEGDDFYQYSRLFAQHAAEQLPLVDVLGVRIRILGASAPIMPFDVDSVKSIDEPADPQEDDEDMIDNLCTVHDHFISNIRQAIEKTAKLKDAGTQDLLVSQILRIHEQQLWAVRSSLD